MAFDPSTLTDYSWSDIAKAAKAAMIDAAMGGNTLSMNGRAIGRITINEAKTLYDLAQQMIAAEANDADTAGIALVTFGEEQ